VVSRKENALQHAVTVALQCYFDRIENAPRFEAFPPYPNQQGAEMRRYCGDLVARLGDSRIIVLEFKELDCRTRRLKEFKPSQHTTCLQYERHGVPIAYAYNTVDPLPYSSRDRDRDWPAATLRSVKRSVPSRLPNQTPNIPAHQTLLEWINEATATGAAPAPSEALGRVHGMFQQASSLRNGALVLIHSVSEDTLNALTPEQLETVVDVLTNNPNLSPSAQQTLEDILGGQAEVFAAFAAPPQPPTPPGGRPPRPR